MILNDGTWLSRRTERKRKISTDDMWSRFNGNDTYDIIAGHLGISGNPRGILIASNCGAVPLRCYYYISFVVISSNL
jgi:hypothetical protein